MAYSFVISIEGIGDDTTKSDGILWYYGDAVGSGNYEWVAGLTQWPEGVRGSIDPRTGDFTLSNLPASFHATDLAAKRLLWTQTRTPYSLASSITAAATTVDLGSGGTGLASSVVWVDDEAIKLGSETAGSYSSCTRGYWGTIAASHDAARNVYTGQSYMRFRLVRAGLYDDDSGTISWRWAGYLDSVDTNITGTVINLTARQIFGQLSRTMLAAGRSNLALAPDSTLRWRAISNDEGENVRQVRLTGSVRVPLGDQRAHKTGLAGSRRVALLCDGALVTAAWSGDTYTADDSYPILGSFPEIEFRPIEGTSQAIEAEVRKCKEIAFWSEATDTFLTDNSLNAVSPTYSFDYPYHPLLIACVLLFSDSASTIDTAGLNAMGEGFGADLSWLTPSSILDDISTAIADTRDLKVDRYLFGVEDSVPVWQEVYTKLLRPYGFFVTINQEGRLGFQRFRLMDVSEYDAALDNQVTPYPGTLQFTPSRRSATDRVQATVGSLPWKDGRTIDINSTGNSLRAKRIGEAAQASYDYSTKDADAINNDLDGELIGDLANLAALLHDSMPVLRVEVQDPEAGGASLDYDLGSYVTFADIPTRKAVLIDGQTGDRTAVSLDGAQFAGMIIASRQEIRSRTYTLDLLLTNYNVAEAVKWRAPAAVVSSVDAGSNEITVVNPSEFGQTVSDASLFLPMMTIRVHKRSGELAAADELVVSSVSSNTITFTSWFASYTPVSGDIIRLTDIDSYDEIVHDNVPRTYAYFDEGDIYG